MALSTHEQELLRAYLDAGDDDARRTALNRLRKRYFWLVMGVVLGMTAPGSAMADAAVDSTFARLSREIPRIEGSIADWLQRTARQELLALHTSANDLHKRETELALGAEHALRPLIEKRTADDRTEANQAGRRPEPKGSIVGRRST